MNAREGMIPVVFRQKNALAAREFIRHRRTEEILGACGEAVDPGGTMAAGQAPPVFRFLREKGGLP